MTTQPRTIRKHLLTVVLKYLSLGIISSAVISCGGGGGGNSGDGDNIVEHRVVFTADLSEPFRFDIVSQFNELYSIDPNNPSSLTHLNPDPVDGARNNSRYELSPDKQWLAFVQNYENIDSAELFVVPAKGGTVKKLSGDMLEGGRVSKFQWSPDGQQLVFLADKDQLGIDEVYLVNVDGSDLIKINGSVGNPATVELYNPQWSPDGRYILQGVHTLGINPKIFGYNLYDTTLGVANSTRITNRTNNSNTMKRARWSPNSDRIIYDEDGGTIGSNSVIHQSYSVTTSGEREMISANVSLGGVTLSPNGELILFRDSSNDYYVTRGDGTAPIKVVDDILNFEIHWSPDSKQLLYIVTSPTAELRLKDVTSQSYQTVEGINQPGEVSWSPTGKEFIYINSAKTTLKLIDAEDLGTVYETSVVGILNDTWSSDGNFIAYSSGADVFVDTLDGTEPVKISGDLPAVSGSSLYVGEILILDDLDKVVFLKGYYTLDGFFSAYDYTFYANTLGGDNLTTLGQQTPVYPGSTQY